jgi:hypothetical protein
VAALIAICLAVPALRSRTFGRFRRRRGALSALAGQGRIEILETTVVDADRRLVLVRCDRIEHLIMIGGPADLVVENDVRKMRQASGSQASGSQTKPQPEPQQTSAATKIERATSAPRVTHPTVPSPRPSLASVPAPSIHPASSDAAAPASVGRTEDQPRMPAQRSHAAEPQSGRRDGAQQPRALQAQPALVPVSRSAEAKRGQAASSNGRDAAPSARLPNADVPWGEPDSLESEIVQAFNVEPRLERNAAPTSPRAPAGRKQPDSATTLGDLADRLEEALAREVQTASKPSRRGDATSKVGEESGGKTPEPRKPKEPKEPKERTEPRERPERSLSAVPEAETRRDQPREQHAERREEAPVISLNARRREAVDPLEDEMARLLGELTGDTKGR